MTKLWSSTASLDGKTKRQASKAVRVEQEYYTQEELEMFREQMREANEKARDAIKRALQEREA